jgi:hypothetical protein
MENEYGERFVKQCPMNGFKDCLELECSWWDAENECCTMVMLRENISEAVYMMRAVVKNYLR